jgi:NAD(P)-dependent dehydrogenase (short-subunit alcohol dehydrogenase family)
MFFTDTSTKGAITSFTRGLSNQILSDKMIRVNGTCRLGMSHTDLIPSTDVDFNVGIAPGPVYTPLVTATFSKSNIAGFTSSMNRPGQPVEVATCCVFL